MKEPPVGVYESSNQRRRTKLKIREKSRNPTRSTRKLLNEISQWQVETSPNENQKKSAQPIEKRKTTSASRITRRTFDCVTSCARTARHQHGAEQNRLGKELRAVRAAKTTSARRRASAAAKKRGTASCGANLRAARTAKIKAMICKTCCKVHR